MNGEPNYFQEYLKLKSALIAKGYAVWLTIKEAGVLTLHVENSDFEYGKDFPMKKEDDCEGLLEALKSVCLELDVEQGE